MECATPLAIAEHIRAVCDGVACRGEDVAFKELFDSYSWIAKVMIFDPAATATYCLPSNM